LCGVKPNCINRVKKIKIENKILQSQKLNKMRLRFYFTATIMLLASIVMAQPPQGGPGRMNPEEMVKRQTEEMVKELSLDATQTEKVTAINKKYADKMGEVFQSSQGNREGMREKMQALRTEKEAELKTVLTVSQFTKYQGIEQKRREEMRQRRVEGGGDSPNRRGKPRGTGDE
jgi:Spy/CpxP family protein refolding chaperone